MKGISSFASTTAPAAITIALLMALPAAAQTASAPATAASPNAAAETAQQDPAENGSSDIIVTAQRRDQRLQDVPISITALTTEELTGRGVTSTHDIGQAVPGLTITESGGYVQPFIRGVGSTVTNLGEPGSAATYIDGVYMPTVNGQLYELANIDSIQVLKGPQGTLFGRNANTGAIIITTRQPQFEPAASATVQYGNYNYLKAAAFVTTGFGKTFAVSLGGNYDRHDGWFINKNPANGAGSRLGQGKRYTVRGTVLIQPTDRFKVTISADVMDSDDASPVVLQPIKGYQGYVPGGLLPTGPYDYIGNENVGYLASQQGLSARINWDVGAVALTSTTAFRHYEDHSIFYDSDTTPTRFSAINNNDVGDNFTQEFLINSNTDSKFNWVVGAFYLQQDGKLKPLDVRSATTLTQITVHQVTDAYAAFADGTLKLGVFEITGGVRYNSETKTISGQINGIPRLNNAHNTWTAVTPRAVLSYHPNRDLLIYASFSQGFKSGAYNTNSLSPVVINPEKVDAYEVGFKLTPAPRLTINGAGFYYKTRDLQVQALNTTTNTIELRNAARVLSKGGDLSITYSPPKWNFSLGVAYLDARFESFPNAQVFLPVPGSDGRNAATILDVTGRHNVRSPDWTVNVAADYKASLGGGGSLQPSFNVYYSSKFFWTVDERIVEPSHVVANASLTWNLPGDRFSVGVFGRNIFNEVRFRNVSAAGQADRRAADEPRFYGVRVGVKL